MSRSYNLQLDLDSSNVPSLQHCAHMPGDCYNHLMLTNTPDDGFLQHMPTE